MRYKMGGEGERKMRTLPWNEHYLRKARHEHGMPSGDLYYSMAQRHEEYGIHPMCEECKHSCKNAGALGLTFTCYRFNEKK